MDFMDATDWNELSVLIRRIHKLHGSSFYNLHGSRSKARGEYRDRDAKSCVSTPPSSVFDPACGIMLAVISLSVASCALWAEELKSVPQAVVPSEKEY